jgi:hypothetical protein
MPADSHDIHRTRPFSGCRRRRGSSALRCGAVAPRHFTTAVQSGSSHEKEEEASDSEGTTDGKGGTFPPDNSESLEVARVRPEIEVGFMSVKTCTLFLFICPAALPLKSIYHCSGQAAQVNPRHINLYGSGAAAQDNLPFSGHAAQIHLPIQRAIAMCSLCSPRSSYDTFPTLQCLVRAR